MGESESTGMLGKRDGASEQGVRESSTGHTTYYEAMVVNFMTLVKVLPRA